jgi:hypothetical protein
MPPIKNFYITTHMLQRIAERGLSLAELKMVVNNPDRQRQQYKGDNGGFVYKFEKEINGEKIVAIAEVKASDCWLISGWIS